MKVHISGQSQVERLLRSEMIRGHLILYSDLPMDQFIIILSKAKRSPHQRAAANRRPAGQSGDLDNLSATLAADPAFPAAVAALDHSIT